MIELIILDRDGVINFDSPHFIKSPDEWSPIPGSLEAIVKLNQAGFKIAVASNQSGVARKLLDLDMLNKIHQKMHNSLAEMGGRIDAIFTCTHHPDDHCPCRKPKPGLIHQIGAHFNIDFQKTKVVAIGDSLRDLEASRTAGCLPILVLTGNGMETHQKLTPELQETRVYKDLHTAVEALLHDRS